jgi:succinate dehydrogenase/fumarate reductase flavoprotein subunit
MADVEFGEISQKTFDLVVVGAGVGGMTTALIGAIQGLSSLVIEKAATVGGTSALSAGTAWIPGSMHAGTVNPGDNRVAVETYLRAVMGNGYDADRVGAVLDAGPEAIVLLDRESEVKFRARPHHPDYLSDLPGATLCGRALEPLPFDGRCLGPDICLVRPPLSTLTFGGMMVGADDLQHLLNAGHSIRSAWHSAGLFLRYAGDIARYGRSTRLLMGNALCARLLASLRARKIPIWMRTAVTELIKEDARIVGVIARTPKGQRHVVARRGVVLATGGFTHSRELRERLLPRPLPRYTATPAEVAGDGIALGLRVGGILSQDGGDGAFWAPVSRRAVAGGDEIYPHFFLDRAKPGVLAINKQGKRFVNESTSYDAFGRAMYRAGAVPCWLVADGRAVRRYGLGLALPGGWRVRRLVREGYLRRAATLGLLARELGIDEKALEDTVRRFNEIATYGRDPDFQRGETAANRVLGDRNHGPNPCLGPLTKGPFYAVELHPGINGTGAGLRTDAAGRVLTDQETPVAGLYACGNDAVSVMAGTYPGPGTTIGPAIATAFLIVQSVTTQS